MKTLMVTLGVGKGTWGKVKRIVSEEWDNIIILGNQWAKDTFRSDIKYEWIILDDQKDECQLSDDIDEIAKGELGEIYINLLSGSGREHNALISSLINNDKSFKVVCLCDDGVKYYGE